MPNALGVLFRTLADPPQWAILAMTPFHLGLGRIKEEERV